MHTHQFMEHRRLDISQHDPMQKFKNTAFDQYSPVQFCLMILLLILCKHIQNHHFMRLLIQLREAVRTDVIVPALNVRRFI